MREDYNVHSVEDFESTMTEEVVDAYHAGGHDGLYLKLKRGWRARGVNWIAHLPGLEYLEILGRVADDSLAFSIKSLRELILLTSCRVPVPDVGARGLRRLAMDDRPGKENLSSLNVLEELRIWRFADQDLRVVKPLTSLRKLHLECLKQQCALDDIQSCSRLVDIEILDACVESLTPLSGLRDLRRLWLIGSPKATARSALNLSAIAGLPQLEEVRITYGTVQSVAPMLQAPALRDLRLRGTQILDGSEELLTQLNPSVTVVPPRG
jgi:hypothetical protein